MALDLIGGYGRAALSERLGDRQPTGFCFALRRAGHGHYLYQIQLAADIAKGKGIAVFPSWSDGLGTRTLLLHVPSDQRSHDLDDGHPATEILVV